MSLGAGRGAAALTLAALGVVFGDIGTSPLYALRSVFSVDNSALRPTEATIYGVVSLVVWAITLIVTVKYVTFVLRADNEGEGGIMALTLLVRRLGGSAGALVLLGVFGASLFYGDAVITPAVSVLAAVEGLKIAAPSLAEVVVPAALVILTALFALQHPGDRGGRAALRPRHAGLVRGPGRRGPAASRRGAGRDQGPVAQLRRRVRGPGACGGVRGAGRDRPGHHRRRGALRGPGPLRARPDPGGPGSGSSSRR
jgi:potassium transporter